jgi:hypothetical protein
LGCGNRAASPLAVGQADVEEPGADEGAHPPRLRPRRVGRRAPPGAPRAPRSTRRRSTTPAPRRSRGPPAGRGAPRRAHRRPAPRPDRPRPAPPPRSRRPPATARASRPSRRRARRRRPAARPTATPSPRRGGRRACGGAPPFLRSSAPRPSRRPPPARRGCPCRPRTACGRRARTRAPADGRTSPGPPRRPRRRRSSRARVAHHGADGRAGECVAPVGGDASRVRTPRPTTWATANVRPSAARWPTSTRWLPALATANGRRPAASGAPDGDGARIPEGGSAAAPSAPPPGRRPRAPTAAARAPAPRRLRARHEVGHEGRQLGRPPLARVLERHVARGVDDGQRRPAARRPRPPQAELPVVDHRVLHPQPRRRVGDPPRRALGDELPAVHAHHGERLGEAPLERAQLGGDVLAVDAAVGPQVHDHHAAAERGQRRRRGGARPDPVQRVGEVGRAHRARRRWRHRRRAPAAVGDGTRGGSGSGMGAHGVRGVAHGVRMAAPPTPAALATLPACLAPPTPWWPSRRRTRAAARPCARSSRPPAPSPGSCSSWAGCRTPGSASTGRRPSGWPTPTPCARP